MAITVGVLSDTHLRRVTKDFEYIYEKYLSGVDVILHAGDFTSPDIVSFLGKKDFHGVHGNMDPVEVKLMLPEKEEIDIGGHSVGLVHGWGPSEGLEDRIWNEFQNVDVIVYGHSHKPANHKKEGVLIFNPGTATGFLSSGSHTIGILDCGDTVEAHIIEIE